jgi:ATP-binding cassette subfamily B protein
MICKYYEGDAPQTQLVNISGTSVTGTTLLGLYQAAHKIGLKAEGLECAAS